MEQRTHRLTNKRLVGRPVRIEPGYAEVELLATEDMAVDEYGLVHGGFTFGLADYAAMLAVNEPTVVLGKAEVKFLKPVKVGEKLTAKAEVIGGSGGGVGDGTSPRRKKLVKAEVFNEKNEKVFEGSFHCYVLERHVLE